MGAEVTTLLEKHKGEAWSVTYSTVEPIKKLTFKRNPDNSRVKRWQPQNSEFVIKYDKENGLESVTKLDGNYFTEVKIWLTPTYTPLPKEYASFSPFSDNGFLFHSGRFFACAELCVPELNKWLFEVKAQDKNIIVGGEIYSREANWIDKDSGQKVYIGNGIPIKDTNFVSLIDTKLPKELKKHISNDLPKLMNFFTNKMGALNYRPALFASYSETINGRYGNQGGTLPGQIFMHWYGKKSIEQLNSDSVFWFFAHEVAHLYQRKASEIESQSEAWLHEGVAEYLAGMATSELRNNKSLFVKKVNIAKKRCFNGLENKSSYLEASKLNPKLHYSCGLLLINAIDRNLTANNENFDIFIAWNKFNTQVESGEDAAVRTFLEVVKPYISEEMSRSINLLSGTDEIDTIEVLKKIAANKSSQADS